MTGHAPSRSRRATLAAGAPASSEGGQALLLLVGAMCAALLSALLLGGVARGLGARGRDQQAADLGALAGARAMRAGYDRLFVPAYLGRRPNPQHLERAAYLAAARARAVATARRNGAQRVAVAFPDGEAFAPTRIRVTVGDPAVVEVGGRRRSAPVEALAEAQLAPGSTIAWTAAAGEYRGPLAYRQGKPKR